MMIRRKAVGGCCLALALCVPVAFAQDVQDPQPQQPPAQQPPAQQPTGQQPTGQQPTGQQPPAQPPTGQPPEGQQPAAQQPEKADPDLRVDVLQPDFVISSLPTTLRLPRHKLGFMVTHRFSRSLGRGDLGDLASDFFGFDTGAQIGLELRYGLFSGTQVGIYRTSDRTIQLFGQQSVMQQKPDGHPLGIDILVTLEGINNLQGNKSGTFGLLVSRKIAGRLAAYVEPMFVANTNFIDEPGSDNNTAMIGVGARLRVLPKMYLVGEITPRVGGYSPGVNQMSFGIEGRAGGHQFQVNFSNGLGTSLGQIARGGIDNNSWFIGFNISRKFF
ncbi:MAG TPA: DUF5777 family beta-barrel protein [Vicinamibacterales bacterium]|nr:DUF5777 family beta-barrel protein [Vicinamibacterales bacterium]